MSGDVYTLTLSPNAFNDNTASVSGFALSTKRLTTRLRLNIKNINKALLLKFPFKDERQYSSYKVGMFLDRLIRTR